VKLGRQSSGETRILRHYSGKSTWNVESDAQPALDALSMLGAYIQEMSQANLELLRPADGGAGYYCPAFGCRETSGFRAKCSVHQAEMTVDMDLLA